MSCRIVGAFAVKKEPLAPPPAVLLGGSVARISPPACSGNDRRLGDNLPIDDGAVTPQGMVGTQLGSRLKVRGAV